MSPERRVVLVGALVASLAAILLGSVAIPAPHDGGDNATYLSLAHSLVSGRGYTELWDPQIPPHTKYPPVFPLALAALMIVGVTTWAGFKLFMALAVGGAAVFAFAWAARRSGPVAAAAVAVLVLLSGGWLQASRWVLSEPLFLLFTFAALWAAERSAAPGERAEVSRWALLAGVLAVLAFFTRSAGLPLVLALLAALVIAREVRTAAILGVTFLVPGLVWFFRARGEDRAPTCRSSGWPTPISRPLGTWAGWISPAELGQTSRRTWGASSQESGGLP